jgi:hypothetical protein
VKTEGRFPGFLGRLRLYLAGVTIGLVMLGFFYLAKQNEAVAKQAAADRAAQQPPKADSPFPTLPAAETAK